MRKKKKLPYNLLVRISRYEHNKLHQFCRNNHVTKSKAVRAGIDNVTMRTVIHQTKRQRKRVQALKKRSKILNSEFENNNKQYEAQSNFTQTIRDSTNQIVRIGNNLNQIARKANKGNLNAVTNNILNKVRKAVSGAELVNMKLYRKELKKERKMR